MTGDETVCEAVCRAVATAEGCSELELEPIGDAVDPDSLDALFSPAASNGNCLLTLRYAGYEVVVTDGEITVLSVP